jgi:hypothetical protein
MGLVHTIHNQLLPEVPTTVQACIDSHFQLHGCRFTIVLIFGAIKISLECTFMFGWVISYAPALGIIVSSSSTNCLLGCVTLNC